MMVHNQMAHVDLLQFSWVTHVLNEHRAVLNAMF